MTTRTLLGAAALALPLLLAGPAHADGPSRVELAADDIDDTAGALTSPHGLGLDTAARSLAGH